MLKSGTSIRFTLGEIEAAARCGMDLSWVKCREDWVQANIDLIEILAAERFDLLERIAHLAAQYKGIKPPAKLRLVDQYEKAT